MKTAALPVAQRRTDAARPQPSRATVPTLLSSLLVLGVASGPAMTMDAWPGTSGTAAAPMESAADLSGLELDPALHADATIEPVDLGIVDMSGDDASPDIGGEAFDGDIDMAAPTADEAAGRLAEWLKPLRVSLKHEMSYKFAAPRGLVNNRSSVRVEYSRLLGNDVFVRLDSKLNLFWDNDHRGSAGDENPLRELVTREAYLQTSVGNTSLRFGYQILPWGVSEGGAITDEVSPRNTSEFFFISLEESRIGQPMVTADHFGASGQWTTFFVPHPSYNKYPERGSEYDIPGAFDKAEPNDAWDDTGSYEYGMRWKRTFGKSDVSLMAASLIDNDYLVRKQRFRMFGLTANIARDNLLFRAEVALKQPRAFFSVPIVGGAPSIIESDQFDSSFGFDYSPGGRALTYSAEVIWSRLLDWQDGILGREQDEYSLVSSVSNRFFNDDLTLSWLTIYTRPYTSFQHKFLSSYLIDDNSTVYFELFYPDERDRRSGTWPYRDQKQFVIRYQYQF